MEAAERQLISRDSIPDNLAFTVYERRVIHTTAAPFSIPEGLQLVIETVDGRAVIDGPWSGWIAIDAGGYPYPIDTGEFARLHRLDGTTAGSSGGQRG